MDKTWVGQEEYDLTQPRHAAYKQIWKVSQDAVYWVNTGCAASTGHPKFRTPFFPVFKASRFHFSQEFTCEMEGCDHRTWAGSREMFEKNRQCLGPQAQGLRGRHGRFLRIARHRNFGARKGKYEKNAVVNNQGTKQRGQRILGDCWQWETNGQCSEGDNCSFRHDVNKHAKATQPNPSPSSSSRQNERKASRTRKPERQSPSARMFRLPCKDYLKGTCTNFFCEKWHPPECLFYKTKSGCRFGKSALMHIARLMNSQAKGPKKW